MPHTLRRAFIAIVLLAGSSGCVLLGPHWLPDEWEGANTAWRFGVSVPLPADMKDFDKGAISIQYLPGYGGNGLEITEYAVGYDAIISGIPWGGGWYAYAGGGLAVLRAGMTLSDVHDSDSSIGLFMHCGALYTWPEKGYAIGVAARYTLGTSLDLHGRKRSADGPQLMLAFMVPVAPTF